MGQSTMDNTKTQATFGDKTQNRTKTGKTNKQKTTPHGKLKGPATSIK
jgi:hypothetical protein